MNNTTTNPHLGGNTTSRSSIPPNAAAGSAVKARHLVRALFLLFSCPVTSNASTISCSPRAGLDPAAADESGQCRPSQRLTMLTSVPPPQTNLHAQLAQLSANLADTENLLRMTSVQAECMRGLGSWHGGL